jgi:hypothetical protein
MNLSNKRVLSVIAAAVVWALPAFAQGGCELGKAVSREHVVAPSLRYRLVDRFQPIYFCDPECIGPCLLDLEKKHALEAFPQIRKDTETFRAITEHLKLAQTGESSDDEKLSIYREYKTLICGMSLEAEGKKQRFTIQSADGFRVEGLINPQGEITVVEKAPSRLTCPK